MQPSPYFHDPSGALRFWVQLEDGSFMGASITKEILHFRFRGDASGSDAMATYSAHRVEIDEAVRRRAARGSIEPVLLREADMGAPRRP
jgi:Protein of unknown function (DUF1488)